MQLRLIFPHFFGKLMNKNEFRIYNGEDFLVSGITKDVALAILGDWFPEYKDHKVAWDEPMHYTTPAGKIVIIGHIEWEEK